MKLANFLYVACFISYLIPIPWIIFLNWEIQLAEKQAINQKVENVFNFSMSQQILIDWQGFLLFSKCVCSNWNSGHKAILIIWNAWMEISHKTSLDAKFDIEDLTKILRDTQCRTEDFGLLSQCILAHDLGYLVPVFLNWLNAFFTIKLV